MDNLTLPTSAETSFEGYYRTHLDEVYRFALSRLRDPDDAEDATQSTFLRAFQAVRDGHRPRNTSAWLITIARNVCHDRGRLALRRPKEVALHESSALAPEGRSEEVDALIEGLQGLPLRQRSALVWRELEGRTCTEIARDLGMSTPAVSRLLVRARLNLREQIAAGVTCALAQAVPAPGEVGPSARTRRALEAHRQWCPACATLDARDRPKLGLLQPLWLALGALRGLHKGRLAQNAAQPAAATGSGGAAAMLLGKAALVTVLAAFAGGVAWEGVSAGHSQPSRALPVAPAVAREATANTTVTHPATPRIHVAVQPSGTATARAAAGVPASVASGSANALRTETQTSTPGAPTMPVIPPPAGTNADTGIAPAPGDAAQPSVPSGSADGEPTSVEPSGGGSSGPTAATDQTTEAPAVIQTQVAATPTTDVVHGQATAPGQTKQNLQGGGKASAPGQLGTNGGGKANAPGQLGTNGGGKANAPGQLNTNGGGKTNAPGQLNTQRRRKTNAPGQLNTNGGGKTTAPGQLGSKRRRQRKRAGASRDERRREGRRSRPAGSRLERESQRAGSVGEGCGCDLDSCCDDRDSGDSAGPAGQRPVDSAGSAAR